MTSCGAKVHWTDVDTIKVQPKRYEATQRMIENDWTSASYWYLHLALSNCQEAQITMKGLSESSKQGTLWCAISSLCWALRLPL